MPRKAKRSSTAADLSPSDPPSPLSPHSPESPWSPRASGLADFSLDDMLELDETEWRMATHESRATESERATEDHGYPSEGCTSDGGMHGQVEENDDDGQELAMRNYTLARRIFQLARHFYDTDKPVARDSSKERKQTQGPEDIKNASKPSEGSSGSRKSKKRMKKCTAGLLRHAFRAVFRASRTMNAMDQVFMDWRLEKQKEREEKERLIKEKAKEQWGDLTGWLTDVVEDMGVLPGGDKKKKEDEDTMGTQINDMTNMFDMTSMLNNQDDEDSGKESELPQPRKELELPPEVLQIQEEAKAMAHKFEKMRKELASMLQHSLHTLEEGQDLISEISDTQDLVRRALASFQTEVTAFKDKAAKQQAEMPEVMAKIQNNYKLSADAKETKLLSADFASNMLVKVVKIADEVGDSLAAMEAGESRRAKSASSKGHVSEADELDLTELESVWESEHPETAEESSRPASKTASLHESVAPSVCENIDTSPLRVGPNTPLSPRLPKPRRLQPLTFENRSKEDDVSLREAVSHMWWRTSEESDTHCIEHCKSFNAALKLVSGIDKRSPYRLPPVLSSVPARNNTILPRPRKFQFQEQWVPPVIDTGNKQRLPPSLLQQPLLQQVQQGHEGQPVQALNPLKRLKPLRPRSPEQQKPSSAARGSRYRSAVRYVSV